MTMNSFAVVEDSNIVLFYKVIVVVILNCAEERPNYKSSSLVAGLLLAC